MMSLNKDPLCDICELTTCVFVEFYGRGDRRHSIPGAVH